MSPIWLALTKLQKQGSIHLLTLFDNHFWIPVSLLLQSFSWPLVKFQLLISQISPLNPLGNLIEVLEVWNLIISNLATLLCKGILIFLSRRPGLYKAVSKMFGFFGAMINLTWPNSWFNNYIKFSEIQDHFECSRRPLHSINLYTPIFEWLNRLLSYSRILYF